MGNLDVLKSKYKPYKYTLNGKSLIVYSSSGNFVIKKKEKDLFELFNYLKERGYDNIPQMYQSYEEDENIFEYFESIDLPKEQITDAFATSIADLHNKTIYFKDTKKDNYKEIYDTINNNIKYKENYYRSLFLSFLKDEYLSPSKYLYLRNYYKILTQLTFAKNKLDEYYLLVENMDKVRVGIVHNNLDLSHFIKSKNKDVLISWDKYLIDTPVIDLIGVFKNEYQNINLENFYHKYFSSFTLKEEEKLLFLVLISIPLEISFTNNELKNTQNIQNLFIYINKSASIVRIYDSKKEEE